MISLKIQCPCGQRFVFDVEPVDGHMPTAVQCPACGVDNTAAANQAIAQASVSTPSAGLSLAPRASPPLTASSVATERSRPVTASAEPKTTLEWYEQLWVGLPLALVAVGGLIGGGFGGAAWAINRQVFKQLRQPVLRYLVTGVISCVAVVAWMLVVGVLYALLRAKK